MKIALASLLLGTSVPTHAAELNNVAPAALVVAYNTPKAGYSCVPWDNPEHPAAGAVDGVIAGSPETPNAEWATKKLTVGAELCLTWSKPVRIQKVRLFDRPNPVDQIVSGELVTDTGKKHPVGELDNAGKIPGEITLDGSPVKQLTFRVTGVSKSTVNAGLAEIEVLSPDKAPETLEQVLPKPVYDENPGFIELHDLAWKQAKEHIRLSPGMPRPLYMDEACFDNTLWIWDTCFMSLYTRYAASFYPGVESLQNFYGVIHDGKKSPLRIEMLDNPPLFAWAELDNFTFNNDTEHAKALYFKDRSLQKHFEWRETVKRGLKLPNVDHHPVYWEKTGDNYRWTTSWNGMDNSPRARGGDLFWLDAISQQGLSALAISRLAERLGDAEGAKQWKARHDAMKRAVSERYWDPARRTFFDLNAKTGARTDVEAITAYWPLIAELATPEQAAALVEAYRDPKRFGGEVPFPSLSRSDKDYADGDRHGDYWRGGVWLPTSYMAIKGMEKYGYLKEAHDASVATLAHMLKTYRTYTPATIWECYSPYAARPSTEHGRRARPDFCGWSALGPVSLFIENIIGIREVDAQARRIRWALYSPEKCGVRSLHVFGDTITDLVADKDGTLTVTTNLPYSLEVNGAKFEVKAGKNTFRVERVK